MKPRYLILPALLGAGLSLIHLLPAAGSMAQSAIKMDLPPRLGSWETRTIPPSQVELDILAEDTRFSKAICFRAREGEIDVASGLPVPDRLDLSIVLSGHDLNNSIHRPERCMPSQGHVISNSSSVGIRTPNGRLLETRRLLSVQSIPQNEEKTDYASYDCVTYYFFVGHDMITDDHLERTLADMKDRLVYGMDQHWAYVSVSMWYGKIPWIAEKVTLEEADSKIQMFLATFSAEQIDWDMVKN